MNIYLNMEMVNFDFSVLLRNYKLFMAGFVLPACVYLYA